MSTFSPKRIASYSLVLIASAAIVLATVPPAAPVSADTYTWANVTDDTDLSSPLLESNVNQVVTLGGELYAAIENSDATLWKHSGSIWFDVTPAVMDGAGPIKYFARYGNKLYAVTQNNAASDKIGLYKYEDGSWTADTNFDGDYFDVRGMGAYEDMLCVALRAKSTFHPTMECLNSDGWAAEDMTTNGLESFNYDNTDVVLYHSEGGKTMAVNGADGDNNDKIWVYGNYGEQHWQILDISPDFTGAGTQINGLVADSTEGMYVSTYNTNNSTSKIYYIDGFGGTSQAGDAPFGETKRIVQLYESYDSSLFAISTNYSQTIGVYKLVDDSWTNISQDSIIGQLSPAQTRAYNLTEAEDSLILATSADDDGAYAGNIWTYKASSGGGGGYEGGGDEDGGDGGENSDTDNISSQIEAGAPNSGDANGDDIPDNQQSNVASLLFSDTGKYISIASTGANCQNLSNVSATAADSLNTADSAYSYPQGLVNFTATCNTNGQSATITLYFYTDTAPTDFVLRKYNPNAHAYTTITDTTLTQVTIGNQKAIKASYTVTDGGIGDTDGQVNGVIIDPAGLALAATTPTVTPTPAGSLPATGATAATGAIISLALIAGGVLLKTYRQA